MSTLAENHALQFYRLLGLYDRAGGKGCGLGNLRALDLLVDIQGIARLSLGLPIPSKLAQNPAQTFLAHSNLDIDAFTGVATSELGTPHDNLAILEELGNHFKGLVVEELHELV